jgi:hypothetical protein
MSLSQLTGEMRKDPNKTTASKTLGILLRVMIDIEGPLS